jgi:hypothetical protein
MRIRIVRRAPGEIDGVLLSRFDPGDSYDVSVSIGTYLVVRGFARAADVSAGQVTPSRGASVKRAQGEAKPVGSADSPRKRRRTPSTSR